MSFSALWHFYKYFSSQVKEYRQKMGTLKRNQQTEKKKNAQMLEEARKREVLMDGDASQLKVSGIFFCTYWKFCGCWQLRLSILSYLCFFLSLFASCIFSFCSLSFPIFIA